MSVLDKWLWRSLSHKGKLIHFSTVWNNTIVMVEDYGTILISTNDGYTWYSKNSGTSNTLNAITFGNNTFVSVGNSGTSNTLNGITFGNNTFVAVGDYGTILISTNNGYTWRPASLH